MRTAIVQFHHDPDKGGFFTTFLFWDCECEEDYILRCGMKSAPLAAHAVRMHLTPASTK